jgi:hypothetical protein
MNSQKLAFALKPSVNGLNTLSQETLAVPTPWNRIVRGLSFGQYSIHADSIQRQNILTATQAISQKASTNSYHAFSAALIRIINEIEVGRIEGHSDSPEQRREELSNLLSLRESISSPYLRVVAGAITLNAWAKLGLDIQELESAGTDPFTNVLIDETYSIAPEQINDENKGEHGEYEQLFAWTSLIFAFAAAGKQRKLVQPHDHISHALSLIETIPGPFFRGRGGSMLITAIQKAGFSSSLVVGSRDYVAEILDYIDDYERINIPPAFPSPVSAAFGKAYPTYTMLNALALTNRRDLLTYRKDRLNDAKELYTNLEFPEQTHMGLYYLVALHNFNLLDSQVPDLRQFTDTLISSWQQIDPAKDYFLYGISYQYLLQTAMFFGRFDLLTDRFITNLIDAYPRMERSPEAKNNVPYPFAYTVNIMQDLGISNLLFTQRDAYGQQRPFEWTVTQMSPNAELENQRLYMLDHALINWILRLRD